MESSNGDRSFDHFLAAQIIRSIQVASKLLRPDQMLTLVKRGLSDKPAVADACRFMLCARWLKDVGYEPVELLKRVDVLQVEVRVYLWHGLRCR